MGRLMPGPVSSVMRRLGTHGPASSVMRRPGTHGPASAGPNPLEAPGSGRLTGGVGPGPKVPIISTVLSYTDDNFRYSNCYR